MTTKKGKTMRPKPPDLSTYTPTQGELSEIRPIFEQFSQLLVGKSRVNAKEAKGLIAEVEKDGIVAPAELWLLWKGLTGDKDRFDPEAVKLLRSFLGSWGVKV